MVKVWTLVLDLKGREILSQLDPCTYVNTQSRPDYVRKLPYHLGFVVRLKGTYIGASIGNWLGTDMTKVWLTGERVSSTFY